MTTQHTTPTPVPEALRLAAWLTEGAWHKMTLGDVEAASRELRRLHAIVASAPVAPAPQPAVPTIMRWNLLAGWGMKPAANGLYVRYEDHAAALAAAPKAETALPYHDGVNIENLQRACRALGLRTDDSLEAFVSPDVHADHINRLTTSVVKYVLTRPAPLQQGEYLPLPVPSGRIEYPAQRYEDAWVSTQDAYSEEQMHAYVDADRAARGAAQAAPAPASGETETCKCCGEGSARIVVRRECDTCTSVYAGVAEHRIQKSLAAPPAQEALLNPDMPTQELRLHMGELTTDEVLVARAAIRWANSRITAAQKEAP